MLDAQRRKEIQELRRHSSPMNSAPKPTTKKV